MTPEHVLVHDHFVQEEEAAHCAAVGMIADVTGLDVADGLESLELQFFR